MTTKFNAEVFQNQYLPQGTREVHAIMTVTASGDGIETAVQPSSGRMFGIICDVSGSMQNDKIQAAKAAIAKLVQMLPQDAYFFIVVGNDQGYLLCPAAQALPANKQQAIKQLRSLNASGGTVISSWLVQAKQQFVKMPQAIKQALLLTDGQNDPSDEKRLEAVLQSCEGLFQCDCRGVGTDWRVSQLQQIATRLLGTTDIIPNPSMLEADFQAILDRAMSKQVNNVAIRLWTPQGATVRFCKQVSPEIVDLSDRATSVKAQVLDYPTGAWGGQESRDYHFCIQVNPGNVGDEMLAGRASLISTIEGVETKIAEARILATWTDDEARSAKIDRRVAHYTGQAELAQSIQEGLEARASGNEERATAKLGRAVQLAHESGNEATAKLLRSVVDIDDAPTGTVRLKRSVAKEDEMMLETRSTKTTRIRKS
ncbi:MAG: VWA domain-containing protein [Oscillatoriales cyanobacterium]|nr:MAG: VWA domain-containing protein [Oscillatoriales cyanobacterium]TAH20449.1 MAG: VWA domain-containing protein [Oscillatoriales cyanobacterium]